MSPNSRGVVRKVILDAEERAALPERAQPTALWITDLTVCGCGRLGVMTFEDLPANWPTLPLTDPRITNDVLDLLVSDRNRSRGAIILLCCDPTDRLKQPCAVGDLDDPEAGCSQLEVIDPFARAWSELEPAGSLLVVIARDRGLAITDHDRGWHQAAIEACGESGLRLLGVHVVTRSGFARLPDFASTHHE